MQKEIEIIKDGLSYNEELECIAKRFGMTQEQTLKEIIHEIYTSSVTFTGLQTAMVLNTISKTKHLNFHIRIQVLELILYGYDIPLT